MAVVPNNKGTFPVFSGPYPLSKCTPHTKYHQTGRDGVRIKTKVKNIPQKLDKNAGATGEKDVPTLSNTEIEKLTSFVNYVSHHVDVKNRYTPAELQLQTSFVENLVGNICTKIGIENPALIVNEILRRGSAFDGTKICEPSEYDFLPILAMFHSEAMKLKEVTERLQYEGMGLYYIQVDPLSLKHPLPDYCLKEHDGASFIEQDLIKRLVLDTIIKVLENMNDFDVNFVGFRNHFVDTMTKYKQGDISLHKPPPKYDQLHGPSIWIRAGGPLCTVDIDICFCIEQKPHELGRSVLIFGDHYHDDACPVSYWKESVVDPPNNDIYQLTHPHHQLLLLLKYSVQLLVSMNIKDYYRPPSSYALKTLLLHHQSQCHSLQVGECLIDVVKYMCKDFTGWLDYSQDTFTIIETSLRQLTDTIYHQRKHTVYGTGTLATPAVLIWLIQNVRHSSECSWWERLVDPSFIGNVTENDVLHSLVTDMRKVDEKSARIFHRMSESVSDMRNTCKILKLQWKHQDKTETLIEFPVEYSIGGASTFHLDSIPRPWSNYFHMEGGEDNKKP